MRALRIARDVWKMSPDFLGSENRDRRREAQQRFRNAVDGGLRRTARAISRRKSVETVLQHVEIKSAEIHHRKIVQRVEDAMEFKSLVPFAALRDEFRRPGKHPAVELFHFGVGHRIARGIETGEISQREAERVAQLAVRLGKLRHHVVGHAHVRRIILRRNPQAQQIRAPLLAHFRGQHGIAQRFRHRLALGVERPPVREHVPVRSAIPHGDADKQRAVEPSAILVRPFEIHIRRPRKLLPIGIEAIEHRQMRRARIEPHIQNVGFPAPTGRAARTTRARAAAILPPDA